MPKGSAGIVRHDNVASEWRGGQRETRQRRNVKAATSYVLMSFDQTVAAQCCLPKTFEQSSP